MTKRLLTGLYDILPSFRSLAALLDSIVNLSWDKISPRDGKKLNVASVRIFLDLATLSHFYHFISQKDKALHNARQQT